MRALAVFNIQSVSLADSVVEYAVMSSQFSSVNVNYPSHFRFDSGCQKRFHVQGSDKTDPLAVLFYRVRKIKLSGQFSDFRFSVFPHWKYAFPQNQIENGKDN